MCTSELLFGCKFLYPDMFQLIFLPGVHQSILYFSIFIYLKVEFIILFGLVFSYESGIHLTEIMWLRRDLDSEINTGQTIMRSR